MKRSAWALALALGLGAGCGSTTPKPSGTGASGSTASSGASNATSTSSTASTSSAATGTGGATGAGGAGGSGGSSGGTGGMSPNDLCVQTGHAGACQMCCASDNASGYNTYVNALIQDCACTTGAACYTLCSDPMDLCSMPSAQTGSQMCIGCLNSVPKTDPCFTATMNSVNAACNADPSCTAFMTCNMGCTGLPM